MVPKDRLELGFEIEQYVQALKSAADRARWAIYVITVVSLLILLAEWNYLHASWSRQQWDQSQKTRDAQLRREWQRVRQGLPAPTEAERHMREAQVPLDDWLDLKHNNEQFKTQSEEFVRRMVLVPIPVLGGSIHVNDLGLVGGLILAVLAVILAVLMAREHENLNLALFKVKRLCARDENPANGESAANLLYHALAMAQVLNDPPTLARWSQHGGTMGHRLGTPVLFFLPPVVQWFVVSQNILSREKAFPIWGVDVTTFRLEIQALLAVTLTILGFISYRYTLASDKRWQEAFFHVNPGLRFVAPEAWYEWIRLASDSFIDRSERDVARQLIYTLEVRDHSRRPRSRPRYWFQRLIRAHLPRRAQFTITRAVLTYAAAYLITELRARAMPGEVPRVQISRNVAKVSQGIDEWTVTACGTEFHLVRHGVPEWLVWHRGPTPR